MYTSYIATILSSMCMDYVSLAWLDSISHVRALLRADYCPTPKGGVATQVGNYIVVSANV